MTGALGCALLSMACNFTIGKDKYKDVEPKIKSALKETESLRKRFLSLVDLDVRAYHKVFNSRKAKENIYQKNLIAATKVPAGNRYLGARGIRALSAFKEDCQ